MNSNKYADLCLVPATQQFELLDYTKLNYVQISSIFTAQRIDIKESLFFKTDNKKLGFFAKIGNNARIIIGSEFDLQVFRGQNKPYPLIPSFKRLDEVHQCVAYIKKEEFKIFFRLTPYFKILSKMSILGTYFAFDLEAIAQHYGFATNYLDITTDEQVALFFAYTYCKNGKYCPITDFTGYQPTLYQMLTLEYSNPYPLIPIGFQAVLRPQKQKAMAIDMTNINNCPILPNYLPKNPQKAQEIYELFNGGKDLLPKDEPIDTIGCKIKNNKILDKKLFLQYCRHYRKDKKSIQERLAQLGYQIEYRGEQCIEREMLTTMENETNNIIIPWIRDNIFYRNIKTSPNAFYISCLPQSLNSLP